MADCLRKCIALGADLRSAPLQNWARQELAGYMDEVDLPRYREIPVALFGNASAGTRRVDALRIENVPESIHEEIKATSGRYFLRAGIAEIDAMISHANLHSAGLVHLAAPFASKVKAHMAEKVKGAHLEDVYWGVKASVLSGLLDQVRTTAVSILTDIRAESSESGVSGTEAASNAIHLHVEGGKRHNITVTANNSSPGAGGGASPSDGRESLRWTRRQTYWTIASVAVALIALYIAYLQIRS